MWIFGVGFVLWFDPKGVCSFFVYIQSSIVEYLKSAMGFLVGILLRLVGWWVSRARMSPLPMFLEKHSCFWGSLPFFRSYWFNFCHQVIKHFIGNSSLTLPCVALLSRMGDFRHSTLFCPVWHGPEAWSPAPHHIPPLLGAPTTLARSLYPYRNYPTPPTCLHFSRNT